MSRDDRGVRSRSQDHSPEASITRSHSLPRAQATGTVVAVRAVQEILPIGVCVLISIAAVAASVVVWRDDHQRDRGAADLHVETVPIG